MGAETTTGASSDLMQVSNMARQMVTAFGMSDVGPWAPSSDQSGDMIMRMMARNSMSEKLQADIDREVKKIADEAYEVALQQIRDNREALEEKETISGDEFRAILEKYTAIPEENKKFLKP